MRIPTVLGLAVAVSLASVAPARAEVRLTIRDGRVSLNATNATVREILAEWAKVGQTKIVNGERVPGGPVTLQMTNVPEEEALDIILRSVAGYLAAPRAAAVETASRFDRILVMPTSAPPRATPGPPPPTFPQPQFNPQLPPPPVDDDQQADDQPATNVVLPPRGPIFNTFPPQMVPPGSVPPGPVPPGAFPPGAVQPGATPPQPPGINRPSPGQIPIGGGVPVPGMVVPAPAQPGQPGVPPGQDPDDR